MKKVPALTCPLPFFLIIMLEKSAGGKSKVNCVLILQLQELCIAELSSGKISQ